MSINAEILQSAYYQIRQKTAKFAKKLNFQTFRLIDRPRLGMCPRAIGPSQQQPVCIYHSRINYVCR